MSFLNTIIGAVSNFSNEHFWVVQIFCVVLFTVVLHTIETIVYKRGHQRLLKTKNFWDDTFLNALHRPFGFFVWVWGISYAALIGQASSKTANVIFSTVVPVRNLATLILIAWFILRMIRGVEQKLLAERSQRKKIDATAVNAIRQLLSVTVIVTSVLVGMQMFNLPISGLVAFGGIGGAAIAFSAKDILANFFGGLMVFLDRPFKVGDWIRSPDRQIEGTVEQIGWRLTRIRTFDKRPLYVPNNIFSNISVENPSRMQNRRIHTNIGLRYDDATKVSTVLADIETMLRAHPEIDTKQTLMVNLVEFGPSSLNFMIYTFTKTTDWVKFQAIQQDVFLKIIEVIDSHGAQCAFPTTTLHIPQGLDLINNKETIIDEHSTAYPRSV